MEPVEVSALLAADHFLCFCRAAGRCLRYFGLCGADAQALAHFGVDLGVDVFILFEEAAGVLAALADALAAKAVPRAALFDYVMRRRQIQHVALAADALAVEDVELGFAEGRGHRSWFPGCRT